MRDRNGDMCFVNISFFQNVGFTSPNEDVFVREGIAARCFCNARDDA